MLVLGIETSCDETAAALVTSEREILSNIIFSQVAEHLPYGGVVPEIAARSHMVHLEKTIQHAMSDANKSWADIDAIAVTGGPGLIGGVIVGVMTAKALASVHKKPFLAVNHLEGHALTARLTNDVSFPFLLLLVSGGHCQYLVVRGVGQYERLGGTMDDALGECFDKVAKMLGLDYPGGPAVEKLALKGNPHAYTLPIPLHGREGCDLSFSGLKTAVRLLIQKHQPLDDQICADICASFQYTAAQCLIERTHNAIARFKTACPHGQNVVVAGGVAANQYLRGVLEEVAKAHKLHLTTPPVKLCTDNAAMIAWAGIERLQLGLTDTMDFEPKARWPLAA